MLPSSGLPQADTYSTFVRNIVIPPDYATPHSGKTDHDKYPKLAVSRILSARTDQDIRFSHGGRL